MRLRDLAPVIGLLLLTACGNTPVPPQPTILPLPAGTEALMTPAPAESPAPVPILMTATPGVKVCDIQAAAAFAPLLDGTPAVKDQVGCPAATATDVASTEEYFERGYMLWRRDLRRIYALQANGVWQTFADTWTEDQPQDDPTLEAPAGLLQPLRGFGKVWRENPDVKDAVGWATQPEEGLLTTIQQFEGGTLMYMGGDRIRVLYADGSWQEFPTAPPAPQETSPAPAESPVAPEPYPAAPGPATPEPGAYPAAPEPGAASTAYP
jgi:hypothetical protein